MIKKTKEYVDFNGEKRIEDFYFNFTKAEMLDMEIENEDGMSKFLRRIVEEKDTNKIIKFFMKLVKDSYGIKSPDGRRFIKNKELVEEFVQTNAYSDIFMELASDADLASAFVNGIIPKDEK